MVKSKGKRRTLNVQRPMQRKKILLRRNKPYHSDGGRQEKNSQAGVDNSILQPGASCPCGIGDARERDHGVERQINSGQQTFEQMIEFLFCPKCLRRGFVAHLDEILHREIRKSIGVFFSPREIFSESALSIQIGRASCRERVE